MEQSAPTLRKAFPESYRQKTEAVRKGQCAESERQCFETAGPAAFQRGGDRRERSA